MEIGVKHAGVHLRKKEESVHGDGEALIAWTNVNVFKVTGADVSIPRTGKLLINDSHVKQCDDLISRDKAQHLGLNLALDVQAS